MRTIWKYEIEQTGLQEIYMPEGARILCVQVQRKTACIWAMVNKRLPMEKRKIYVTGTDHDIEDGIVPMLDYIGTFQLLEGALVWHVFELVE